MSGQQSSHRSSESSPGQRTKEGLPPLRVGGSMTLPELTSTTQIPLAPGTTQAFYHMMTPSLPQYHGTQASHMGLGAPSFSIWAPTPLRLDGSSTSGTALLPHPQLVYDRPTTSVTSFLPPHPPIHLGQPSDPTVDASVSPHLSRSDDDDDDDDGGEDSPPIIDPGVKEGRGISTPGNDVIPQNDPGQRIPLSCDAYGGFTFKKAKDVISFLIRMNFDTNYLQWDEQPLEHKEKLWNQFGRYFRWEKEEEQDIYRLFNDIGRIRFIKALSKAKEEYVKENKRVKWLEFRSWKKLVRHWRKEEVIKISERAAKNRGVQRDEEGKKMPAKATYFGGTISMYAIDKKRAQMEDRPFAGQSLESYVFTHVRKIPNKPKDEFYAGRNDLQWTTDKHKERYERYMIAIADKNKDNPNAKLNPLDPIDASVWEQAIGGVQKGRLPGVSRELAAEAMGFHIKKRRAISLVSGSQAAEVQSLQNKVEELRGQIETLKKSNSEIETRMMEKVEAMMRSRFSEERREDVYIPTLSGQDVEGLEFDLD